MGVCLCELIGMDAYSQFHITRQQLPRHFPKLDMESVYMQVLYTATLAAQAWQSILDAIWRLRSAAYQLGGSTAKAPPRRFTETLGDFRKFPESPESCGVSRSLAQPLGAPRSPPEIPGIPGIPRSSP